GVHGDCVHASVGGRPRELGAGAAEKDATYASYPIAKPDSDPRTPIRHLSGAKVPRMLLARPGLWIPNATHLPNPYAGRLLLAAGWRTRWSSSLVTGPGRRSCVRQ